ncbi:guanine nucleotide exchange factor C9orf72-like [Neocloeon triangulifer]|uniref:guanine nucleotide exchange factor C9orf72-like n=1 Tax=Neocloeon triangulifer TaxID=2078957 RepID=UPI00286F1F25|nr:guanine nucleotide exchange factor C9orf72-like [Neocloeon triangulifer]
MDAPLRSLAMSANVANSVNVEVGHLIRVASNSSLTDQPPDLRLGDGVEVNVALPSTSPLLFMVLARWDDVVGPQTLYVWLPKQGGLCGAPMLGRRVRYVTSHAVSCNSVTAASGAASLRVVPDLRIVFMTRLFHASRAPFAVAAATELDKLYFVQGRHALFQDWMQRLADKIAPQLRQCDDEIILGDEVTSWILDFNFAVSSMKEASVDSPLLEDWYGKDLLKYPALAQALTSHLQTFGQSVVIGDKRPLVNSLISFLSLFLDNDQSKRSRFVPSHGHTCFHVGLCLQGLLVSGYGYRPISSEELSCCPLPVTTIDLTRSLENGAVKQTEPLHKRTHGRTNFEPRSLLLPVKEGTRMVATLLQELQMLPTSHWRAHVAIFNKRLDKLAEATVSHVRHSSDLTTCVKDELKRLLGVDERELVIVAARAEKIKPGVFVYIFGAK